MTLRSISKLQLIEAFRALRVPEHRTIGIVSDLAAFGDLEASSGADSLAGYVECVHQAMQADATIVVPTFTYLRRGQGSPYVHEESRSETGALTDFIRKSGGSVRSLHPIFSFTAVGPAKHSICDNASPHSYGWNSPAQRLIEADALMLSLGLPPHRGMFLLHVAEVAMGVPYRYTKELSIPVFTGGEEVNRPFFHFVKHTCADIVWDTNRIVERLDGRGQLSFLPIGATGIWACRARDVFDTTIGLLSRNIYGLLAHAPKQRPWSR